MEEHVLIYQMLATDTAISNAVGQRIYPVIAPTGAVFPCIVFRTVSVSAVADADNDAVEYEASVEIIAMHKIEASNSFTTLRTIVGAIRAMGERLRAGFTTAQVAADMDAMYLENERDEVFEGDIQLAARALTYRMYVRKT